jgi:hypothetical protein
MIAAVYMHSFALSEIACSIKTGRISTSLYKLRKLLFDFVSQNTKFQFYFGLHSVSTRHPVQLYAPFHDSYCGSGSLLKVIKQLHKMHGSETATIVVTKHAQKEGMLQFEKLVVDSCWLSLSNTVNLTAGGGTRPTDAMIAEAHSRVKSWMEKQSVLWMEKAAKLYAEHEKRKISTGSAAPVPRLFIKKTSKN